MMDYRLRRISNKYISAGELPAEGDLVVTIARCETETIIGEGGRETTTGVLYFQGWRKGMVLNAGNGKAIRKLYGKDDDAWLGKAIALYRSTTSVGPEPDVPCIRVRPSAPKAKRADAQPNEEAAAVAQRVCAELEAATSIDQLEQVVAANRATVRDLPAGLAELVKRTKAAMSKALAVAP